MSTTQAASPTHALAPGWRMWVPCLGMALCSWLSFVDRQVLAILSPTILARHRLTPQDFTNAASFFFLAYTLATRSGDRFSITSGCASGCCWRSAIWTAASMSHAWMSDVRRLRARARRAGLRRRARRSPAVCRTAVESLPAHMRARGIALSFSGGTIGAVMMPLLLGPLAIRYGWRAAFLATGALGLAWMLIWAAIARPPFLPKNAAAAVSKLTWPNLARASRLGAHLQLRAAGDFAGTDPDDRGALSQPAARPDAGGRQSAGLDSAADLGHRLFLLGMGGRSLRREQSAAGRDVPAADSRAR